MKKMSQEARIARVSERFAEVMKELGLDLSDPSLKDTPERVAKMYCTELFRAVYEPPPKLTLFPNDNKYAQLLIERNITVHSVCEHHFVPFSGVCHIGYFPGKSLLGLSKFHRIVQYFASKPQVQERLTEEIAAYLMKVLGTKDVAVMIKAQHLCCTIRGVRDPHSDTATISLNGVFLEREVRDEFYHLAVNT